MTRRFVIVSSDPDLTSLLSSVVAESGLQAELIAFDSYPAASQLRRLVEDKDAPVIAVIVGLGELARATRVIEDLCATHPELLVVAADTGASAERILAAMRAGASEFLSPPFDLEHLVRRSRQNKSRSSTVAGRLVCFMPSQGGNGASTVALHVTDAIRRELGREGKKNGNPATRPLLIDYDFHSGTLAFRLRLKPEYSVADALTKIEVIDELWGKIASDWKGMDILPAPPPRAKLSPEEMGRLSAIFTSATRAYPYVLVDLPTALFSSCRDLLISCDAVYLVSTPEMMALHLAKRRVEELQHLGLPKENIRLVLNRVGGKRTLKTDDVEEVVGVPVQASIANDYNAFNEAYMKGTLIKAESPLGRQFGEIARQIMGTESAPPSPETSRGRWRDLLSFD